MCALAYLFEYQRLDAPACSTRVSTEDGGGVGRGCVRYISQSPTSLGHSVGGTQTKQYDESRLLGEFSIPKFCHKHKLKEDCGHFQNSIKQNFVPAPVFSISFKYFQ